MKYNTPMNGFYNFSPESAFKEIKKHWLSWDSKVKPNYYVLGISGGIDSSCVAALACKIFGKDKVIGVSLPCNGQFDIADVDMVFKHLEIRRITIDIGDMFNIGLNSIENQAIDMTDVCRTNMPARLRMVMLYGIAQCFNGIVLNTCQLSETYLGNDTIFGDNAGSYAPIKNLTKTEVKEIARWLGLSDSLVKKTPIDGLQPLSDEDRLGITYDKIDAFIRSTDYVTEAEKKLILDKFFKNKFKSEIVNIPGPEFGHYPNIIRANYSSKFL